MAKRYGLVIDLERCIGCNTCIMACKLENSLDKGSWIRVETIGGTHRDSPEGQHPQLSMHFLPILCMHCDKPPCLDACPLEAISRRSDGIVIVDEKKCDGCQACLSACPYSALVYDAKNNIVQKCTLCVHRIEKGLEPFCKICCETEAIYFGDINDPDSIISKMIAARSASTLRPQTGTSPTVHYCPTRHGRIE
jgi:molybdopterin-containing oxidoreductase family iron-sulfur binding subunit